jgi:hypothetical protein
MERDLQRAATSVLIWDWCPVKMIRATTAHSCVSPRLVTHTCDDGWLGAHSTSWPFGPDTDLRRHGEKLMQRGGKNAKKRAIVAVARKLAVLLHRLWITGEVYQPLRNSNRQASTKAA